ncbi:hypothetical protein BGZ63DRAFT_97375 [Mariannaea sp. PMI_226]|nr:hypothetical protein BGZ63DRAFT_97375 [Mariannaea sp. PMI_226]
MGQDLIRVLINKLVPRKRHVKCDEAKPSCLNCMKWRGYCDGYVDAMSSSSHSKTPPSPASIHKANSSAKLIHTKKAPLILEEPSVNTNYFANAEQRSYFDEWSKLSINFLSGGLGDTRLWTVTMPQITLHEQTLRYGAMAVGALRKACETDRGTVSPGGDLTNTNTNKHYLNAIVYYCEALRMQSKAKPTREGLRTAMLSSLLFICFESQRGNMPAALKHVIHGFSMLNELAACTSRAPDLVSIAPAPPALVEEILDCYKPIELQSRSYTASYTKFFSPPKPQASASSRPPGLPSTSPTATPTASSPPSQPGSPWQGAPPTGKSSPTALPSPQSQGSPSTASEQQPSVQLPRAPPQRPPHIAPFSRNSPYFRPKLTNITKLEDLPPAFGSLGEAHGYWSLVQRHMVQWVPVLAATTARLALNKVVNLDDLDKKLSSVKENPVMTKFVGESRYWIQRWSQAFDPLLKKYTANRHKDMNPYLHAINLRIEFLILFVYTSLPRFSSLETAEALTPQYHEITLIAETLISNRPNCGFAMDSGWTWPLFVASFSCRDHKVKDNAIRILQQYPIRNALRDSRVFGAIALKNRDVELAIAAEGQTREERWLLLRRRDLVFEDLGTNVIYRSAQKNQATGQWELVEEIAPFMVEADGLLDWHRQPISESLSALSGFC